MKKVKGYTSKKKITMRKKELKKWELKLTKMTQSRIISSLLIKPNIKTPGCRDTDTSPFHTLSECRGSSWSPLHAPGLSTASTRFSLKHLNKLYWLPKKLHILLVGRAVPHTWLIQLSLNALIYFFMVIKNTMSFFKENI